MSEKHFFIGWEDTRELPRRAVFSGFVWAILLLLIVGIGAWVGALQRTPGKGMFAFGDVQTYRGVLLSQPSPMLIVDDESGKGKICLLVNPLKHGFRQEVAGRHHLKEVTLKGTIIGDELNSMIEVVPGSVAEQGEGEAQSSRVGSTVMLKGEIVDSKCHLGVMNPGRFKTHRACAIQCIAGGIPPLLVIESVDGQRQQFLIVDLDGKPVNDQVLDYIAEPIRLGGKTKAIGSLQILYADLSTLSRL